MIDCALLYQFPSTRFASNSLYKQWWYLLAQIFDISLRLLTGNLQRAAVETWALKQEAETMHRILSGRGADIEMAKNTIISDCLERGYYDQERSA